MDSTARYTHFKDTHLFEIADRISELIDGACKGRSEAIEWRWNGFAGWAGLATYRKVAGAVLDLDEDAIAGEIAAGRIMEVENGD